MSIIYSFQFTIMHRANHNFIQFNVSIVSALEKVVEELVASLLAFWVTVGHQRSLIAIFYQEFLVWNIDRNNR